MNSTIEYQEVSDQALLRRILSRDPLTTGYMLGDLDEAYFDQCRWLVGFFNNEPLGVVLIYQGLSVPVVLTYGAPDLISGLFEHFSKMLPENFDAKIPLEHKAVYLQYFRVTSEDISWVMGLSKGQLSRQSSVHEIRRLRINDELTSILAVYEDYPGHYFEPSQLENGIYFGLFLGQELVSISGTHVYAPNEGVAVLGNVVTRRQYRSKGYSRVCTGRLIEYLIERGCVSVSLQVEQDNRAAITVYRHLRFQYLRTVLQATCVQQV